jgi:hypothetical protein
MLAFERAHPQECLGVRFEDLTRAQDEAAERIEAFLGLAGQATPVGGRQRQPESAEAHPEANLPVDLVPPNLLTQANKLLRELSYPALPAPLAS